MKTLEKILSWVVTILLPVALTFIGVRILLTHAFPEIEYRLPGFPADEYGFTLQDRLQWSKISIDYLINGQDISFLGDLTFPDGSPLFNSRELSHMLDVKNVVQPALWVGYGIWFIMIALGFWAYFAGWWSQFIRGIWRGGWLTVGLVAGFGALAAISFWQFFTVFHELFFTGNTWQFLYSDTLIRLFPMRFWQDAFLFAGMVDVGCGLSLGLALLSKRKQGVITDDIILPPARRSDD
jgi:integral membrane protein (TIGR01906 family)